MKVFIQYINDLPIFFNGTYQICFNFFFFFFATQVHDFEQLRYSMYKVSTEVLLLAHSWASESAAFISWGLGNQPTILYSVTA